MMGLEQSKLWKKLRFQLSASPRQAKLLGALAVVLLVVVVRLLSGGSPDTVLATEPLAPATTDLIVTPEVAAPPTRATRPPLPDLPEKAACSLFESDWLATTARRRSLERAPATKNEVRRGAPFGLVLEMTLTGAVESDEHYAVISGHRVRVGDVIGRYVVESIAPSVAVLTTVGGARVVLRMD